MNKFKAETTTDLFNPNCIQYEEFKIFRTLQFMQPIEYTWVNGIRKWTKTMSEKEITEDFGEALEYMESELKQLVKIYRKRLQKCKIGE